MADSTELAHRAAREGVRVTYRNARRPVVDIAEAAKDGTRVEEGKAEKTFSVSSGGEESNNKQVEKNSKNKRCCIKKEIFLN